MNYLGLDYGVKHIGVAMASGPLAEPLTTIPTEKLASQLLELIKKHSTTALVIGMYHASMHDTLLSFGLPIHQVDETLSSHDARQSLEHKSQSARRTDEHAAAAAIILQSFLDSHVPTR